jgi:hypothetical protein
MKKPLRKTRHPARDARQRAQRRREAERNGQARPAKAPRKKSDASAPLAAAPLLPPASQGERWAILLLALALFPLSILTYNHLNEDAFITFRYVRNFAAGHGLVFNPGGDWVEGYSNLLWALLLTPWEWLGVRLHLAARLMATGFFAALVWGAWSAARRFLPQDAPVWLRWWLPLALAADPLLHYFDDGGLETVPFAALLGLATLFAGSGQPAWAGLCAGLAVPTRPEGIALVAALLPAVVYDAWKKAGPSRAERDAALLRGLRAAFLLPLAMGVGQLVFRLIAYREWVPNTVAAKTGAGIANAAQDWETLGAFFVSRFAMPAVGLLGCALALTRREWRLMGLAAGGSWAAAFALAVYGVGRVPLSFRYMAPLIIPSMIGCWLLVAWFWRELVRSRGQEGSSSSGGWLAVALALTVFGLIPHLWHHRTIQRNSIFAKMALGNQDHPNSRFWQRLLSADTWTQLPERWEWFLSDPIYLNSEAGRWLRANLPADATIAADQVGQLCYYAGPEQSFIDLLGLNDWRIARFGLSEWDIHKRSPDYFVLMCYGNSAFEPAERHLKPVYPSLAALHNMKGWRQRWALQAEAELYNWSAFVVYVRADLDDGKPLEVLSLGVEEEEFRERWRLDD